MAIDEVDAERCRNCQAIVAALHTLKERSRGNRSFAEPDWRKTGPEMSGSLSVPLSALLSAVSFLFTHRC